MPRFSRAQTAQFTTKGTGTMKQHLLGGFRLQYVRDSRYRGSVARGSEVERSWIRCGHMARVDAA